ncbi:nucleotide phosphatase [Aureococcus anophagefferens]|nr:nucleotide phosphatase [Aureococcus anophagefferens]
MSAHTLVTTDDAHTLETDFEVPAPRIIMLTGRPGVGKTTIVRAALDAWTANGRAAAGFHTREELRDDGRRAGFEIVAADGRTASLSRGARRGAARRATSGASASSR